MTKRLRAMVNTSRKVFGRKKGKGFSIKEIVAAGAETNELRHRKIPFDPRRKTLHATNVQTLKSFLENQNRQI